MGRENIGYNLTRDYVKKIIGGKREYQLLYRQKSPASASRHAALRIQFCKDRVQIALFFSWDEQVEAAKLVADALLLRR